MPRNPNRGQPPQFTNPFAGLGGIFATQPIDTRGKSRFSSGANNPASRPGTDKTRGFKQGMGGVESIPVPDYGDRVYMQEVVNLAQQPDPYMQNAGMYVPDL